MAASLNIDFPSQWTALNDLAQILGTLSSQQCVADLQEILKYMKNLEATIQAREETIRQQEQTMSSKSNEFIKLEDNHTRNIEKILETHRNVVKKIEEEKETMQKAMEVYDRDLQDAESRFRSLQHDLQTLRKEAEIHTSDKNELKGHLDGARGETETLKKVLETLEVQAGVREQKLKEEILAHKEMKKQAQTYKKESADLKKQLNEYQSDLDRFNKWGPVLDPDNEGNVTEQLGKLWKKCYRAVLACSTVDIAEDVLQDQSKWQNLKNSDLVTHATPLPPTNNPAAKRMRLFVVLAILAQSLMSNIFTVSYLFRDVHDINSITLAMADIDRDREAFFRRMLNSAPEPTDGQTMQNRLEQVLADVIFRVEPLLTTDQVDKLRTSLTEVVKFAIELWKSLQGRTSHFAAEIRVSSDTPAEWKALKWDEAKRTLFEDTCQEPVGAISVLFPRVFMVSSNGDRNIFSGMLLLQPETVAAYDELSKLSPVSPSNKRTSIHRSTLGRRNTGSDIRGNGAFLGAHGTQ